MAKQPSMQALKDSSFLTGGGDNYLETLYETYLKNPEELSPEWRDYFIKIAQDNAHQSDVSHEAIRQHFQQLTQQPRQMVVVQGDDIQHLQKQEKITNLIAAYRSLGHLQADLDPLGLTKREPSPTLELSYYGFTDTDMDVAFDIHSYYGLNETSATLRDIYNELRKTYCRTIGIEFMHIDNNDEVLWLQKRMEKMWVNFSPTHASKLRILDRLISADGLEKYLGFKYVGQKRFSLEGGDGLIPMLDAMINRGSEQDIKEIIIGMAHRGRLNVLVNVLGKESKKVFDGFEGRGVDERNSGDVKYHLGYSANIKTQSGSVHLALAFNPSHLEIVSPVVQGSVRARQRRRRDKDQVKVMPIQIHGDAAFAAQGVVAETFNMSQARWFSVGGSVHIVINNQVGFTTSDPRDARSTFYCTDVAKMVQAPVIHVNGNDPEACFFAAQMAVDFRTQFKKDIVIDLICYRRHGHNEADEPSATQPLMYKVIKSMAPPASLYAEKLKADNIITAEQEKQMLADYRQTLDEGRGTVPTIEDKLVYEYAVTWEPFLEQPWDSNTKTGLDKSYLVALARKLEILPEGFVLQAQVRKMLEARQKMTNGELPLNWGYAETLAYATLLDDKYPIRLCGQDASRGTFAHRHAVLHDQNTDRKYLPLSFIKPDQMQINVIDSLLSEEAVLAFEYGFASAEPNNLVIWEAQFGDFVNGAQVVIDQFISSGEQKWGRLCGLVMYLPHGYEGAGPEHSSARLERFLQLCAQENMQVCMPTTPAQMFHLIRRQMVRSYRKPLIVMTPKSLLRHPEAVSTLDDLTRDEFQLVIPEIDDLDPATVDRVVFCSGKVYYDILDKRRSLAKNTVALLRVEQLYPFPTKAITAQLEKYAHVKKILWCQEEPQNQGSRTAVLPDLQACLTDQQDLQYVGRKAAAAPSVGYMSVHLKQQAQLVADALGCNVEDVLKKPESQSN